MASYRCTLVLANTISHHRLGGTRMGC